MIGLALLAWVLVAAPVALLIGNSIAVRDEVEAACKRDAEQRTEWDVSA